MGSLAQRFYGMDVKDRAIRASLKIPKTCHHTELSRRGLSKIPASVTWENWVGLLAKLLPEPRSRASLI